MAKILIIALALWCAWRLITRQRRAFTGHRAEPRDAKGELMVQCARCGLNVPKSESLAVENRYFCCAEHEREHRARG
jgi:uncharacterized protein